MLVYRLGITEMGLVIYYIICHDCTTRIIKVQWDCPQNLITCYTTQGFKVFTRFLTIGQPTGFESEIVYNMAVK
jgi:hypothetical protein